MFNIQFVLLFLAERKGFEPPKPFPVYLLSKQASSTTPAPLQDKERAKNINLIPQRKKILFSMSKIQLINALNQINIGLILNLYKELTIA
jgi:hypothetical protein